MRRASPSIALRTLTDNLKQASNESRDDPHDGALRELTCTDMTLIPCKGAAPAGPSEHR